MKKQIRRPIFSLGATNLAAAQMRDLSDEVTPVPKCGVSIYVQEVENK
jgi:hypothetical protein